MLEIRYIIETKQLTGWCGDLEQFGKLDRNRPTEAVVILDIPIPDKPVEAWLFDGSKLIPNPDYIEPEPPFDAKAEIDELRAEIDKLKE